MKFVASVFSVKEFEAAVDETADMIEIRIDLVNEAEVGSLQEMARDSCIPVIVTIRSLDEGGEFTGTPEMWHESVMQWTDVADFVDIERAYAEYAASIKAGGSEIIASAHLKTMLPADSLKALEDELRAFGDIPKIVVTPETQDDLLTLLAFTLHARRPVCTGVIGSDFRYARALLPLFGSHLAYCYVGTPTAGGQYHINDLRKITEMLHETREQESN